MDKEQKRGEYRLRTDTPADFCLCRSLLKSLAADAVCTDLKLLREQLQDGELIIQPTQLPLQYALIMPFLFLQSLHL